MELDLTQQFEYEKIVREINDCDNIDELKSKLKEIVLLSMKKDKLVSGMLKDTLPTLPKIDGSSS
tara:strand:- start:15818 stop:16012 length:195 start_codon:yes stop_codon:yes gene_type:complete